MSDHWLFRLMDSIAEAWIKPCEHRFFVALRLATLLQSLRRHSYRYSE